MGKRIKKYVKLTLAIAIVLAAAMWTVDWLLLKRKIAQDNGAYGQVEVHRRFAIHLKNKRVEEHTQKPHMEECVRSLFPHYDETPCWYLEGHANQLDDVDGSPWRFYTPE